MEYYDNIRETFIIMYVKDETRYIFNRSVQWNSLMNTKNIQPIIKLLGKEALNHFIVNMYKAKNEAIENIESLTNNLYSFDFNNSPFYIIETHPEWENYNHRNQSDIDVRKNILCGELNAVCRIDHITDGKGLDLQIAKTIKKEFKKWLIEIYDAIAKYAKLIKEETVHTSLGNTKEKLQREIDTLKNEIEELREYRKKIQNSIIGNKKTLARQNFIIDNFNSYINRIPIDNLEEIKSQIAYGKYC